MDRFVGPNGCSVDGTTSNGNPLSSLVNIVLGTNKQKSCFIAKQIETNPHLKREYKSIAEMTQDNPNSLQLREFFKKVDITRVDSDMEDIWNQQKFRPTEEGNQKIEKKALLKEKNTLDKEESILYEEEVKKNSYLKKWSLLKEKAASNEEFEDEFEEMTHPDDLDYSDRFDDDYINLNKEYIMNATNYLEKYGLDTDKMKEYRHRLDVLENKSISRNELDKINYRIRHYRNLTSKLDATTDRLNAIKTKYIDISNFSTGLTTVPILEKLEFKIQNLKDKIWNINHELSELSDQHNIDMNRIKDYDNLSRQNRIDIYKLLYEYKNYINNILFPVEHMSSRLFGKKSRKSKNNQLFAKNLRKKSQNLKTLCTCKDFDK